MNYYIHVSGILPVTPNPRLHCDVESRRRFDYVAAFNTPSVFFDC
jgi:hypothetical protein